MSGRILALDLATNTGWCFGRPGEALFYGSVRIGLPSCSLGRFAADFETWLVGILALRTPDLVVFEAPILTKATALIVARKLIGLATLAEKVAYQRCLDCRESTPSVVAEYFIGRNRWPGGTPEKKARTIEACRALGHDPADDDAADAIALWCFTVSRLFPKHAPKRWNGPLLGAAS